jgi:hypothetical protein
MRRKLAGHTRFAVCRGYERLRKQWQSLIEGRAASLESHSHEEATSIAHAQMVDHRRICRACKDEDLTLGLGEEQPLANHNQSGP